MLLREARGPRSMTEVAAASGVPVETLRKIETGRIATPAFFTVAALAASVGLSPEDVVAYCADAGTDESLSGCGRERGSAWAWPGKVRSLWMGCSTPGGLKAARLAFDNR